MRNVFKNFLLKAWLRLGAALGPGLGSLLLIYFLYHMIQGDRGLLAMVTLNQRHRALEQERDAVATERAYWEKRTRMLRPESIDPDMLNELVRRTLGYVDRDDVVLPRPLILQEGS